ncbi:hypothetical protein V6N12_045197 [Hibiscus sabdariffa]|uniref:Uncharacterized protein n=1 Tax=Hibiscus sabdariffa TaxID=183260 RepID=A0ABR2G2S1_9ROSI
MSENDDPNLNHMLIDTERVLDLQEVLHKNDPSDLKSIPHVEEVARTSLLESLADVIHVPTVLQSLASGKYQHVGLIS